FGTNDLTQTTLGMSRDDYGSFIRHYLEHDIVPRDPFQMIDFDGVGGLMKMGVEKGRGKRGDLKIGICGEHGGDPDSVKFCYKIGLNYVSCSRRRWGNNGLPSGVGSDPSARAAGPSQARPYRRQTLGRNNELRRVT